MIVNSMYSATNAAPARTGGSGAPPATVGSFEQQLSTALSETLGRLGVAPGEINITIRTGQSGTTSPTQGQIIISYSAARPELTAGGTTVAPPAPTITGNPFLGRANGTEPPQAPVPPDPTPWSPYSGPRDTRDKIPLGGGVLGPSGAPVINLNDTAAANQYNYTGLAAKNPYFTSPSNPLRDGYVPGFEKWFEQNFVVGPLGAMYPMSKQANATTDGAAEALRLVQQLVPDAKLTTETFGGGPYAATRPTYYVSLPDGRLLNAGRLVNSYYNQGFGVTASSDDMLRRAIDLA